jgi:hypothetical protein
VTWFYRPAAGDTGLRSEEEEGMGTISIVWFDGAARHWYVPYTVSLDRVVRELDFHLPLMGMPRAVAVLPWREDD